MKLVLRRETRAPEKRKKKKKDRKNCGRRLKIIEPSVRDKGKASD